MTEHPKEIRAIAGGNLPVETFYSDNIVEHYTSQDVKRRGGDKPNNRALWNAYKVVEIRHYKKPGGAQHEYVVAKLEYRDPAGSRSKPKVKKFYVKLERGGGDPNQSPLESKGILNSGSAKGRNEKSSSNISTFDYKVPVSANSSYSPAQIFKVLDAKDRISQVKAWPASIDLTRETVEGKKEKIDKAVAESKEEKDFLLKEQKLQGSTTCTLADLAILAYVIHTGEERYKLLSRQCYWFADTVMQVLTTLYAKSQPASSTHAAPTSSSQPSTSHPVHIDADAIVEVGPDGQQVPTDTNLMMTMAEFSGPLPADPQEQENEHDSDAEEGTERKPKVPEEKSIATNIKGTWNYIQVQKTRDDMVSATIKKFQAKQQELNAEACPFLNKRSIYKTNILSG